MAATAQETVSAVVSESRFDTIAVLLDTLELEVSICVLSVLKIVHAVSNLLVSLSFRQSANPNVLADDSWPHALHLLGHIYNQDL